MVQEVVVQEKEVIQEEVVQELACWSWYIGAGVKEEGLEVVQELVYRSWCTGGEGGAGERTRGGAPGHPGTEKARGRRDSAGG